ncbi:MAG: FAD-dependent oxidoreductase [Geminicoccaceae bacterium]
MAKRERFDLVVVGGGINGAGIVRDAAGRGLSALLVERDDLASHTSSWSSKLIHGGLRYLEHYEFRLVRELRSSARCRHEGRPAHHLGP